MEKVEKKISVTVEEGAFFRNCFSFVKGIDESEVFKKFDIYQSLKPLVAELKKIEEMKPSTIANATPEQQLGSDNVFRLLQKQELDREITLVMESTLLDWVKGKWKEIPALYELRNSITGESVQKGLSSEQEVELYMAVRNALDSATIVGEKKSSK